MDNVARFVIVAVAALSGPTEDLLAEDHRYGGASLTGVNYGVLGMSPLADSMWSYSADGWATRIGGSNAAICTNVNLPTGALVEGVTTYTDDTDIIESIQYILRDVDLQTNTVAIPFAFTTGVAPGLERTFRPLSPPITISNDRRAYSLCISGNNPTTVLRTAGATVWYRLQVSPAPLTATFPNDVPASHPLFRFVEALAASGITAGCGADAFCPDAPLTRGQMAVFLAVALGLHFPN